MDQQTHLIKTHLIKSAHFPFSLLSLLLIFFAVFVPSEKSAAFLNLFCPISNFAQLQYIRIIDDGSTSEPYALIKKVNQPNQIRASLVYLDKMEYKDEGENLAKQPLITVLITPNEAPVGLISFLLRQKEGNNEWILSSSHYSTLGSIITTCN